MGQRFVACDREQSFLMPPDIREWLPARHLAWFVIDAVAEMNLEAFYAAYRVDGRSRPPYDPAMMVALLLYAYARGIPSSRAIERACVEDVAFRVIAAQQRPDHATIATEQAEDELYGDSRGDELPPEFSTSAGRRGWLREAKTRLEAERTANPPPVPRDRSKRPKKTKRRP